LTSPNTSYGPNGTYFTQPAKGKQSPADYPPARISKIRKTSEIFMYVERPGTNSDTYSYGSGNLAATRNSWGTGSVRSVALSRHNNGFNAAVMDGHSERIKMWPITHAAPTSAAQGWAQFGDAIDETPGTGTVGWNATGAKIWLRENTSE